VAFGELERKRIDKVVGGLCRRRTRPELAHELRFDYLIEGHSVILFEERPDWQNPAERMRSVFAKLRLVRAGGLWTLYWQRADLKWHAYRPVAPTPDLTALLEVLDRDEHRAFFG